MHGIIFLKAKQLVRRLLREELDRNALVVHSNLGLLSNVLPGHRVSDTARAVLIFLDGADELVASFNIDLTCFDDLLQDLGILTGQNLKFTYKD